MKKNPSKPSFQKQIDEGKARAAREIEGWKGPIKGAGVRGITNDQLAQYLKANPEARRKLTSVVSSVQFGPTKQSEQLAQIVRGVVAVEVAIAEDNVWEMIASVVKLEGQKDLADQDNQAREPRQRGGYVAAGRPEGEDPLDQRKKWCQDYQDLSKEMKARSKTKIAKEIAEKNPFKDAQTGLMRTVCGRTIQRELERAGLFSIRQK